MLLVRVSHMGLVENLTATSKLATEFPWKALSGPYAMRLTSLKVVLVVEARLVCDLDATSPLAGVLEQVDIRALVEAMMAWSRIFRRIEVVNVPKPGGAMRPSQKRFERRLRCRPLVGGSTHRVATFSSPFRAAILLEMRQHRQTVTGREGEKQIQMRRRHSSTQQHERNKRGEIWAASSLQLCRSFGFVSPLRPSGRHLATPGGKWYRSAHVPIEGSTTCATCIVRRLEARSGEGRISGGWPMAVLM